MTPTRIVLTIDHQLHAQLLKHAFSSSPTLEVVGEATHVIECMILIADKNPHLWIHSWDEGPELEAVLSHVYASHPYLSVIRISPNEPAGYFQTRLNSLSDLLKFAARTSHLNESA